jgi:hypothetical protein
LPHFEIDRYTVRHIGFLDQAAADRLERSHPQHRDVFRRLVENQTPIPCSAFFRFNLTQVLQLVLNRLGPHAVDRFSEAIDLDGLGVLDDQAARALRNFDVIPAEEASRRPRLLHRFSDDRSTRKDR